MRDLITDVKISINELLDDLIGIFTQSLWKGEKENAKESINNANDFVCSDTSNGPIYNF